MSTHTQKAIVATEIGKPLVLTTDHPIPRPGPSQVQVRDAVAGTNPAPLLATRAIVAETLTASDRRCLVVQGPIEVPEVPIEANCRF